jgi:hypothetical protein
MEYRKLTNEEYHNNKTHISSSGLKLIAKKSVFHYLNQKPFTSKSMNLGSAIHSILLEPGLFDSEFYVSEKFDMRTKAGKLKASESISIANGRTIINEDDYKIIQSIQLQFNDNDLAQYYCKGLIEGSFFGEINGVKVRVRPDCYNKDLGFIYDVKSCQDNSPRSFKSDCYKYGYPLQAVCYSKLLGVDPTNFKFIAVETNHPFSVQVYTLSDDMINYGKNQLRKALSEWQFYLETKIVNLYSSDDLAEDGSLIL